MSQQTGPKKLQQRREEGVTRLSVSGFKSISREQSIEIRPLTILAGANSSGKSTIMQPLLLLKQTLEETYDPGALLLYGPNVKFTSVDQLLSCVSKSKSSDTFEVGISVGSDTALTLCFHKQPGGGIDIQRATFLNQGFEVNLRLGMTRGLRGSLRPRK
jgi:AAA15 family ATPase/GTPase